MVRLTKSFAGSADKIRWELRKASSPRASHTTSSAWPIRSGSSAMRIRLPSITSSRVVEVPYAPCTIESGS